MLVPNVRYQNDEPKANEAKAEGDDGGLTDDADLKVILLGDSAVGKSKLVERYLMDQYIPRQVRELWLLSSAGGLTRLLAAVNICADDVPQRHRDRWSKGVRR